MRISLTKHIAIYALLLLISQVSFALEFVAAKSSRIGSFTSLGGTVIPHLEVNLVAKNARRYYLYRW